MFGFGKTLSRLPFTFRPTDDGTTRVAGTSIPIENGAFMRAVGKTYCTL